MIYKIYLIDANNGIALLETTFKEFEDKRLNSSLISKFFNEINEIIDQIQNAMAKGKQREEMTRVIESERSMMVIYFHPQSKILFCTISDTDDDKEKLIDAIVKIANRFWKKHESDIHIFRTTTEKSRFQTIITDIENLTHGGHVAEVFPKLLVMKNVLEKILTMGMINASEFQVALQCNGKNSPLKISRILDKNQSEIYEILNKLKQLDIIEI